MAAVTSDLASSLRTGLKTARLTLDVQSRDTSLPTSAAGKTASTRGVAGAS